MQFDRILLAEDEESSTEVLAELEPLQRDDFEAIFSRP